MFSNFLILINTTNTVFSWQQFTTYVQNNIMITRLVFYFTGKTCSFDNIYFSKTNYDDSNNLTQYIIFKVKLLYRGYEQNEMVSITVAVRWEWIDYTILSYLIQLCLINLTVDPFIELTMTHVNSSLSNYF